MRDQDHIATIRGLGGSVPAADHPWTEPDFASSYETSPQPSQSAQPRFIADEAARWEDQLRRGRSRTPWLVPAAIALGAVGLVTLVIAAFAPSDRALGAVRNSGVTSMGPTAATLAARAENATQAPRVTPAPPARAAAAKTASSPTPPRGAAKATGSTKKGATSATKTGAPRSAKTKSGTATAQPRDLYGRR
jgi:hypothetical protein